MGHLFAAVETVHALVMAAWVLGLPLLFWHRWPKITRWYAAYAIAFVVLSQLSRLLLGECFLTTLARLAATRGGALSANVDEWFTVRVARLVFGLAPSKRSIVAASELGMVLTAAGVLFWLHGPRPRPPARSLQSAPTQAGPFAPRVAGGLRSKTR